MLYEPRISVRKIIERVSIKMENLFCYWLLLYLKGLLMAFDYILDCTVGFTFMKGWRKARREAKEKGRSAQLVNIAWKAHPIDLIPHGLINFLYTHEKYIDPQYILENQNVTLFFVDKDSVTFCVTDPSVDVYDMNKYPFVFYAHYEMARKLIIMSLEDFYKLGEHVGDPKVDVSLLQFTARCGSTLISQMMAKVPNTRSMSEPWCMARLEECYNFGYYSWETYKKLVQAGIRLHCKVEPGSNIERIFIKMTCVASPQFEVIHEMFPKINLVFNTRHPKPSIPSLMKVLRSINDSLYAKSGIYWHKIAFQLTYPHRYNYDYISRQMNKWWKPMSYEESYVHVYVSALACYLETKNIFKHVVLYENLVGNPENEVETLMNAMNVPLMYKKEAMSALEKDSQGGKFGQFGEKMTVSEDIWAKVQSIFDQYYTGLSRDMTMEEFKKVLQID